MVANGRVAIVSGGSRGLGAALVERLLADGYSVATFSRRASPFVQATQARDPDGSAFLWEAIDVTDRPRVNAFVRNVARRYGRVDALVNNSAVAREGILTVQASSDIEQVLHVNLESTIFLTQAVAKVMLAVGSGGAIVSISSVNALRGSAGVAVYSATKAGMDGFTRSLARELGPQRIRVNSVAPGFFESELTVGMRAEQKAKVVRRTPLGKLVTVTDVVAAVAFLLSDAACSITGHVLTVDGGLTC